MMFETVKHTRTGTTRSVCQDAVEVVTCDGVAVSIACDGVGSRPNSDIGATLIASMMREVFQAELLNTAGLWVEGVESVLAGGECYDYGGWAKDTEVVEAGIERALEESRRRLVTLAGLFGGPDAVSWWMESTIVVTVAGPTFVRAYMVGDGVVGARVTPINGIPPTIKVGSLGPRRRLIGPTRKEGLVVVAADDFSVIDTCSTSAGREGDFWRLVLSIDDGDVEMSFAATDGWRHVRGEDALAGERADFKDPELKVSEGYVDDLGVAACWSK